MSSTPDNASTEISASKLSALAADFRPSGASVGQLQAIQPQPTNFASYAPHYSVPMYPPILPYVPPGYGPIPPSLNPARFQMFGPQTSGWIPAASMFGVAHPSGDIDGRFMAQAVFNGYPATLPSAQDRRNGLSHSSNAPSPPVQSPFDRQPPGLANLNVPVANESRRIRGTLRNKKSKAIVSRPNSDATGIAEPFSLLDMQAPTEIKNGAESLGETSKISYSDMLKRPPPPSLSVKKQDETTVKHKSNKEDVKDQVAQVEEDPFPPLLRNGDNQVSTRHFVRPPTASSSTVDSLPGTKITQRNKSGQRKDRRVPDSKITIDLASVVVAMQQTMASSSNHGPAKQGGNNNSRQRQPKPQHHLSPSAESSDDPQRSASTPSPRSQKTSKLKKVILQERRKRSDGQTPTDLTASTTASVGELSRHDGTISEAQSTDQLDFASALDDNKTFAFLNSPTSATNSSVSFAAQSSTAFSPTLSLIRNSILASAVAGLSDAEADAVTNRIHRRQFREYAYQTLNDDLDEACTAMLADLRTFQQRAYEHNQVKAKQRRRFVCGLREATKYLKLGKARCIILAPNLERIPGKGGLDELIVLIANTAEASNVGVVFALGRIPLGRACGKPSPVSCVTILSPAGADEKFHRLISVAQLAKENYCELVKTVVAEEVAAFRKKMSGPSAGSSSVAISTSKASVAASGGSTRLPYNNSTYYHGHSRNASNISAISFISTQSDTAVEQRQANENNDLPGTDTVDITGDRSGEENVDVENDAIDNEQRRQQYQQQLTELDKEIELYDNELGGAEDEEEDFDGDNIVQQCNGSEERPDTIAEGSNR